MDSTGVTQASEPSRQRTGIHRSRGRRRPRSLIRFHPPCPRLGEYPQGVGQQARSVDNGSVDDLAMTTALRFEQRAYDAEGKQNGAGPMPANSMTV